MKADVLSRSQAGQGMVSNTPVGFRSSSGNCQYSSDAWRRVRQLVTLEIRLMEACSLNKGAISEQDARHRNGPRHGNQAPDKPAGVQGRLASPSKELPFWAETQGSGWVVGEGHGLVASGCPELTLRFSEWESNNQSHCRHLTHSNACREGWERKRLAGETSRDNQIQVKRSKKNTPIHLRRQF